MRTRPCTDSWMDLMGFLLATSLSLPMRSWMAFEIQALLESSGHESCQFVVIYIYIHQVITLLFVAVWLIGPLSYTGFAVEKIGQRPGQVTGTEPCALSAQILISLRKGLQLADLGIDSLTFRNGRNVGCLSPLWLRPFCCPP